jgi:hypothetical protein
LTKINSGEVTHTNLKVFDLIRLQLNIKIYHTQGKDTNHYLTDVVDHCGNCRNKYHFFFYKTQVALNMYMEEEQTPVVSESG